MAPVSIPPVRGRSVSMRQRGELQEKDEPPRMLSRAVDPVVMVTRSARRAWLFVRNISTGSERVQGEGTHNSVAVVKPIGIIFETVFDEKSGTVNLVPSRSNEEKVERTLCDDLVCLGLRDSLDLAEKLLGSVRHRLDSRITRFVELVAVLLTHAMSLWVE
jgi:hypothetical protein